MKHRTGSSDSLLLLSRQRVEDGNLGHSVDFFQVQIVGVQGTDSQQALDRRWREA